MARQHRSSLNGRGIADFDEFIIKNSHIILRSCLIAFCFDPTTLIEIAAYVIQCRLVHQSRITWICCLKQSDKLVFHTVLWRMCNIAVYREVCLHFVLAFIVK